MTKAEKKAAREQARLLLEEKEQKTQEEDRADAERWVRSLINVKSSRGDDAWDDESRCRDCADHDGICPYDGHHCGEPR